MPAAAKPTTLSFLRVPADACNSKNHHTVDACGCLQMPAPVKTTTLAMPAGSLVHETGPPNGPYLGPHI